MASSDYEVPSASYDVKYSTKTSPRNAGFKPIEHWIVLGRVDNIGPTKRDDSCKWEGTGKEKTRSSTPVKITGDQHCSLGSGCELGDTVSVGFEATTTWRGN